MRPQLLRLGSALAFTVVAAFLQIQRAAAEEAQVDTALVVSVDVSNSVDAARYKLQMEGIAKALEDPGVIDAITSGPNGGILFSMVTWADTPSMPIPWTRVAGKAEALALAKRIRTLPHQGGEFTCMTRMLRSVNDKVVTQIPAKALRVLVDVSGDGPDNCNADEPIERVRDELVASGVTINGLPILLNTPEAGVLLPKATPGGMHPLEQWYREHVMAGPGAFVLPALGYEDFGRAIRQKFVIEISNMPSAASKREARYEAPPGVHRRGPASLNRLSEVEFASACTSPTFDPPARMLLSPLCDEGRGVHRAMLGIEIGLDGKPVVPADMRIVSHTDR